MRCRCPSIFATLTIYALILRSSDNNQRELAENRARLVMLALREISETWPASSWILRLFETLLKNLHVERSLSMRDQPKNVSSSSASDRIAQEQNLDCDTAAASEQQQEFPASVGHRSLHLNGGVSGEGNGQVQWDRSDVHTHQAPLSVNGILDAELLPWFPDDWLEYDLPDSF